MVEIKRIDCSQTYALRHEILRPNQSLEDCKYTSDHEENTFHLGAFINNMLISIASFSYEIHPSLGEGIHYRLRGMATRQNFRKQHAGSTLIHSAEAILAKRRAQLLWCNARITVANYYTRLGFQEYGEIFDIPPIGLHKLMYKLL
ncbi:GNAT family N-acetyltransferase [Bacillus sp. CGMCC 1.60114]|uniref:GNAT family N-acetyltransferase n=1 Tax=unclassified Bacillus (in: firmicutes) TaxID=185979 RepID=UPI0036355C60